LNYKNISNILIIAFILRLILCGNLRETFFINQLFQHQINYSENSDFFVNNKYTFEIGGKNKAKYQIKDIGNSSIKTIIRLFLLVKVLKTNFIKITHC